MTNSSVFLNRVGTAVPGFDVHPSYLDFARAVLGESRERRSFDRLVSRAQIDHRYSVVPFEYYAGTIPDTAQRMLDFERCALPLAERAVEALGSASVAGTTHLILTTCTGFYAPGIDIQLIERFGLDPSIERTIVGFMGCYAAVTALKLARHIVRSERTARVLIVNLELCSLHLAPPTDVEQAMGFSIFGDGCAASIVSADAVGLSLDAFSTTLIPETRDEITWRVGSLGFEMRLAMDVPAQIAKAIARSPRSVLAGAAPGDIATWAIHPGGRAVLDAVSNALDLARGAVDHSRDVLRAYGNMSSATIVFVLDRILRAAPAASAGTGCALAFGPGMMCETMRFTVVA
jgi:predicted naringenin-chalcone synthase